MFPTSRRGGPADREDLAASCTGVDPKTQLSLVYLVAFGAIGVFPLYLFFLRRMSASGAIYVLVLAPIVTVALDALLLGERVTAIFIVGGGLVLVGVYVGAILHKADAAG